MSIYRLSHLSDPVLLRDLAAYVAQGRANTAIVLAHVAEVDARRLYLPAGHPSMFSYCVHELRFSEDAALKRIQVARAAQKVPAIFEAVADGRLHLSAVNLLAPHMTEETADELIAAATHKTKAEIELLLAGRFPKPDVPTRMVAIAPTAMTLPEAQQDPSGASPAQHAPGHVGTPVLRDKVAPLSAERFSLQLTLTQATHDKLRHAQALLGHHVSPGDIAEVLDRALDALFAKLEKRKFAATDRPRATSLQSHAPAHIPAHVRRAVWERDGGQCTFVGHTGKRCPSRTRLEFDHVLEVARGGSASVPGVRLRCRAHNQYTAECTFGVAFMNHKRRQAIDTRRAQAQRAASGGGPSTKATRAEATSMAAHERPSTDDQELVPCLRNLGFRADETRRAVVYCAGIPNASIEDRVRAALSFLRPRRQSHSPAGQRGLADRFRDDEPNATAL